ncbi:MAG: type II toxin-antitoxin system HicB family antitoxin [Chloroflexi bacterium]|nr:type II toxin-antitoxin system HicB family antitoxin [Chloroflexota bacterium]
MKAYTVRIAIEPEDDGRWSAWAPDLPGCATWGYTQEEALANIQEAFTLYIETLIDEGLPIPPAVKVIDEPTITVNVSAA